MRTGLLDMTPTGTLGAVTLNMRGGAWVCISTSTVQYSTVHTGKLSVRFN
jgi:hypothetical protein